MKLNSFLLNSLMIFAFSLLGFGVGKLIGNFLIGESDPSWRYYSIPTPPEKIIGIVNFQLSSNSNGPAGDTLYAKAESGKFYSYTLFQSNWLLMNVDPTPWSFFYDSKCATEWVSPSTFSQLEDYPPVEKGVIDSAGVNFETPPITYARCYMLLDNSSLQAWIYSGNAKDLLKNRFLKKAFMITGMSTGFIISLFIILYKKRKVELAPT